MNTLRVATWNIAGGRKIRSDQRFDYQDRDLDYFARQLGALDLDVICLQESEYKDGDSIAERLAKLIGMTDVFETRMHPSHVDPSYGMSLAILSKLPPARQRAIPQPYPTFDLTLPNGQPAKRHVKYLQTALFGGVWIANTQTQPLEYLGTPYESERGATYAKELCDMFVSELQPPLIFAGDFCADLHTVHVQNIYKEACDALHLADALPAGQTKPNNKGRADAIFYTPDFAVKSSQIIPTETDHFLCWAELESLAK